MRHQYNKMERNLCIGLLVLLASAPAHNAEPTRWSRQLSSYTSDISDWVPLTKPVERFPDQPIKRQAVAQPRILSEPFSAFSRPTGFQENVQSGPFFQNQGSRPLYLQSVPSASQNFLTDQGFGQQSIRLALGAPQFPLSQGFVAPSYSFDNSQSRPDANYRIPQLQQGALPNPVKFEQFQKQHLPSTFGIGKIPPPPAPPTHKPVLHTIPAPKRPESPKFMEGYRIENASQDFNFKKRPQSLQKLKMDSPQFETFNQRNEKFSDTFATRPRPSNVEREEVQLLYVPVESLNRGQYNYKTVPSPQTLNRDLFSSPAVQRPDAISQPFSSPNQRPQIQRPQVGFQNVNQDYLSSINSQKFDFSSNLAPRLPTFGTSPASPFPTIATTPKPKKLKPHQPPLAVFMVKDSNKLDKIKVADVLSTLKSAKNIAVLDSVNAANSPNVFIGPSSLSPPENYVKFELPYLSNLDNTDRKLRQLPFFVAPLSYSTPEGFAKIPFPSPHVGSVIVNSLLKDSNPNTFATSTHIADVIPNSYTAGTPAFQSEKQSPFTNSVTTKPTFTYFSTVPPKTTPTQSPSQSEYFSFEPQGVKSIKPSRDPDANIITAPPAIPPYFSSFNTNFRFPSQNVNFPQNAPNKHQITLPPPETSSQVVKSEHFNNKLKLDRPSSSISPPTTQPLPSTTKVPPSKAPATFPSHLLETHNPFSINQAFEFSSPLDFHNVYEENKKEFSTPSFASQTPKILPPSIELSTEKENVRSSPPNYFQNYSPEIHYQTEILSSRFPNYDSNSYSSSTETSAESEKIFKDPIKDFSSEKINEDLTTPENIQTSRTPEVYDKYYENKDDTRDNAAVSSTTTSTTTRRPPRTRGRPRYTTPKSDSNESTTRATVTRKPVRERRPLPSRNRYETSGKPSTERSTPGRRQPDPSSTTESSAYKSTRIRTRGRLHYKPTEHPDELYEVNKKSNSKKEKDDIAYQRDVLHQNYPVTLMERMSTVDIEAITSPSPRISSTRFLSREPATENYNAEATFVTEQPSQFSTFEKSAIKEIEPPTSRSTNVQTEATYVPRFSATINEEPSYYSRSSTKRYEEPTFESRSTSSRYDQNEYVPRSSTSQIKSESTESIPVTTEAIRLSSYEYSDFDLTEKQNIQKEEEPSKINKNYEISNTDSPVSLPENNNLKEEPKVQEDSHEVNTIPPTITNYRNKPRTRTFPSRQHPASTSSTTAEPTTTTHKVARLEIKRRPIPAVTYRPAFERRRTTMRIEEIEAELKTKQIHSRPEEIPENRHPVYKPEPTTEPSPIITTQPTKKTNQYRRRRPSTFAASTTTDTAISASKKPTYETKNRFRGRRPTSEKPPVQNILEDTTTSSTPRSVPHNRYNHRARVPESRFNRKPATTETPEESNEENEQDADYSIHRPKIVPFEEPWSTDISNNSFKPYNPNDIQENTKSGENYGPKANYSGGEEVDIITVRNDYDDILVSVTPASNRLNKKIPDMPPTLEALVEQSKTTTAGGDSDTISTIESVIEEMMKSLEEQDEDEYTRNVMKHEGGEIGEIPPEKVITSGETASDRGKQNLDQEPTTDASGKQESPASNEETAKDRKGRRRGYWKRVKVRPVTTESIEVAESQFYTNTVNHVGEDVKPSKTLSKHITREPASITIAPTTPVFTVDGNSEESEATTLLPEIQETVKLPEIDSTTERVNEYVNKNNNNNKVIKSESQTTIVPLNLGDMDLGTGSPDPTLMDMIYEYSTQPTEPTPSEESGLSILETTKDISGVMDYFFGFTATDESKESAGTEDSLGIARDDNSKLNKTEKEEIQTQKSIATEVSNTKFTTETSYIPAEITDSQFPDEERETEALIAEQFESTKKVKVATEAQPAKEVIVKEESPKESIQTSTETSSSNPPYVISTSMSTEVSHETEICFRGKCIKTNKDLI